MKTALISNKRTSKNVNQKPIGSAPAYRAQCTLPPQPIYQILLFESGSETNIFSTLGVLLGVSIRWTGMWNGTMEWKMEWNSECTQLQLRPHQIISFCSTARMPFLEVQFIRTIMIFMVWEHDLLETLPRLSKSCKRAIGRS